MVQEVAITMRAATREANPAALAPSASRKWGGARYGDCILSLSGQGPLLQGGKQCNIW